MTMTFIGLHGKAHSGKDTVASILKTEHDFVGLAFATPIKDALITMFGLQHIDFEGPAKERAIEWLGESPRKLMQTLGTDWGRLMIGEDLWIRSAGRRLKYHAMITGKVVVTDVRFENEAAWVRENGGVVWHIDRDTMPASQVRRHSSEAGICIRPGVDSLVDNNGTLEQLRGRICQALAGELVVIYP